MKKIRLIALVLAALLLLSACGGQTKNSGAELPPAEDGSEIIPDRPHAPDGSEETDDGSLDDGESNRIAFDPRPGLAAKEQVQTYIAYLHDYSERFIPEEQLEIRYDMEDAEFLMETYPERYPPALIFGAVMDLDRTDAADVQMAIQVQKNMTNNEVWDLVGNPHSIFEYNHSSGRYDPEFLKTFFVLNNGQVLTVIYDRNDNASPWIVTDAVIEDIDSTIDTHFLRKFGNLVEALSQGELYTYDDLAEQFDSPGQKIEIEGFDTVALYEWKKAKDNEETHWYYIFVQEKNEFGENEYIAVHYEYEFVPINVNGQ